MCLCPQHERSLMIETLKQAEVIYANLWLESNLNECFPPKYEINFYVPKYQLENAKVILLNFSLFSKLTKTMAANISPEIWFTKRVLGTELFY